MEHITRYTQVLVVAISLCLVSSCVGASVSTILTEENETQQKENRQALRALRWEETVRASALKSARRWEGVVERTGNNDHPMITIAMRLCGLPGDKGYAWCAACISEIFNFTSRITAPVTARAREFFDSNVIWDRRWNTQPPIHLLRPAQVVGYRLHGKWDENHVEMLIRPTERLAYIAGGNTSGKGQFDPDTYDILDPASNTVQREADGFYYKVRYWHQIDVIADYCLTGEDWKERYMYYINAIKSKL